MPFIRRPCVLDATVDAANNLLLHVHRQKFFVLHISKNKSMCIGGQRKGAQDIKITRWRHIFGNANKWREEKNLTATETQIDSVFIWTKHGSNTLYLSFAFKLNSILLNMCIINGACKVDYPAITLFEWIWLSNGTLFWHS